MSDDILPTAANQPPPTHDDLLRCRDDSWLWPNGKPCESAIDWAERIVRDGLGDITSVDGQRLVAKVAEAMHKVTVSALAALAPSLNRALTAESRVQELEAELRRVDSLLVHRDNAIVARLEAVKKFLAASGHDLCHENRRELAAAFGLDGTWPSLPPEQEFAEQCIWYRHMLYGHNGPGSDAAVYEAEIKELEAENARLREALLPLAEAHSWTMDVNCRDVKVWEVEARDVERAKALLEELK